MKKGLILILLLVVNSVSVSALCSLDVTLLNQDPDPAIPGEYTEVVFQMSGVENSECGGAGFELIPTYPFSLDAGVATALELKGPTYAGTYSNAWNIPFNLKIDKDAIEGENSIKVHYSPGGIKETGIIEQFNITIEDSRADFIVSVKNYDSESEEITFEILNIGEHDVEALTIDVPPQPNFVYRGTTRIIVGDLDSNEDTTFTFKARPKEGEITMDVSYTDAINERRVLTKTVFFNPDYFKEKENGYPISFYLLIILIVIIILNYLRKWVIKRRRKHRRY